MKILNRKIESQIDTQLGTSIERDFKAWFYTCLDISQREQLIVQLSTPFNVQLYWRAAEQLHEQLQSELYANT